MHFTTVPAVLFALASYVASQETHLVTVGDGGIKFSPTSLENVAQGDTVVFEFRGGNHSVTQSTFADPCTLMTTPQAGIDSDYMFLGDAPTQFMQWSITIDNSSAPLWFYCKQGKHCQNGMVFAINPTAEKTFDKFAANAAAAVPSTGGDGAPAASGGASASGSAGAPASTGGASASSGAGASGSASSGGASGVPTGSSPLGTASVSSIPASSASAAEPSISPAGGAALGSTDGNGAIAFGVLGIWQSAFVAAAVAFAML